MREIKFRAWDKKNKWMDDALFLRLDGDLFDEAVESGYNTPNLEVVMANRDNFILMQYTGLKDCQGVEIYESDIVQYKIVVTTFKGQIVFGEANYLIYDVKDDDFIPLFDFIEIIEVIGNIHENPSLLEVE